MQLYQYLFLLIQSNLVNYLRRRRRRGRNVYDELESSKNELKCNLKVAEGGERERENKNKIRSDIPTRVVIENEINELLTST